MTADQDIVTDWETYFQLERLGQWLKGGRCDISAELMSIGFFLDPNLTDILKITGNQVG